MADLLDKINEKQINGLYNIISFLDIAKPTYSKCEENEKYQKRNSCYLFTLKSSKNDIIRAFEWKNCENLKLRLKERINIRLTNVTIKYGIGLLTPENIKIISNGF